ncbi:hemicentin-1-like [Brachyhypopomus gauderio]|uniref:hemicentin-1-like n=1 Tax=Brachyhypopomus gauderio TaxID=698409 RepID=UPI0040424A80
MINRLLALDRFSIVVFLFPLLLHGQNITDPGAVLYRESMTSQVVERQVTLECGTTLPDMYIWGFTKPGTDKMRVVVYNFGKGPKFQQLAEDLGDVNVISNNASLSIEKLRLAAEGLYTCQAVYDTDEELLLFYYYMYLRVLVPLSKPYILPSDSAVEGSPFLMRCGLENGTGPIHYTWEQESYSGLVTTLAESNSSVLIITWVTRNHTGWYRCLARNEVNQQRSDRIWVDVLYGPDLPRINATAYSVTENGYSVLEKGNVSLMCQASSNPPSQYIWLFNNSQIYTGPQLIIHKVLRVDTGYYACLAENSYIGTRSRKTIGLTVYYPPDGGPSCSILPVNNYTDLALFCSWVGGFPPATLNWSPYVNGDNREGIVNVTRIQPGPDTANNTVFFCYGSHVALNVTQSCSTQTWMPYGEPQCSANSSRNNEYLMLSCSWEGGFPRALLWWVSSSGDMQGTSEENSNILVLRSSANYNGKTFVCHAKHPLAKESKQCVVKLETPALTTEFRVVSAFEGTDVQLSCMLGKTNPPATEITWFNSLRQNVDNMPKKYVVEQGTAWSNLTVREAVENGLYWCSAINAIGRADVSILLLVIRYPKPPNVTINKIMYNNHQRTDVNVEWQIQMDGDITGFFIEIQRLPGPVGSSDIDPLWQKVAVDLEPSTRSYQINNLDPTGKYAFRITAVNRRTVGNPSEVKSPASMPVSKPYILLSDSSTVESMSVWMSCGLEKGTGPIHYTWEQESYSGLVTTLAESNSSVLNITWVTRNHTGWYRCLARNEVNQQRSDRIWLNVIFGPDLPQIDVTPYSVTDRGYSALEKETVSLTCQASSNPPSQYVWFYNNSEVYTEPQLTITKILRKHTGNYACLAHNMYLNTRSRKAITLTVYYPPDGGPSCSILPVNNYTDLALFCSWKGGFPPATLKWIPYVNGDNREGISNVTQIQPGPETANNSALVCYGSHVAQNIPQTCNIMTWMPYGEPQCSSIPTLNNKYLMLSCSWEGGSPEALLWWVSSSGDMQGTSKQNSSILVLHSSANYSGKEFVCHAKHPLAKESKQCVVKLEAPVLKTQRSVVSVYEGNDVQLTCILSKNYPTITEITWYNNLKQNVGDTPMKYILQQGAAWFNLTVRETDSRVDSGQYWCSAANAVGGAEIPVKLLVMRYPMPPNVTITKILYTSHQRTDVIVEWQIQMDGDITGFFIERQRLSGPVGRSDIDPLWQKVVVDLEPSTRSYQINNLDPTGKYAFRITAVNQRTVGNPSEVKRPGNPPFRAYPAVIGAAIGGMLVVTIPTVLLFLYVVKNRNNIPRLHDMIFGRQNSQSRENITIPEDEAADTAGVGTGGQCSPGTSATLPRPAAIPTNMSAELNRHRQ